MPTSTEPDQPLSVDVHLPSDWAAGELRTDTMAAFSRRPIVLAPKWLYDERGSQLFDAITRLPEYYQTEAERRILIDRADRIAELTAADTVIELGSGTSDKTRTLLDAAWRAGALRRFVPVDVSQATLVDAAKRLASRYPGLQVHAIVGDFTRHLDRLPPGGRRLIAFLGGTVGNFYPGERERFFDTVAGNLAPGGWFLLGVDLVKPIDRLVAAYFDRQGVTAEFIKNGLLVLNRELAADFDPDAFDYVPFWDPVEERVDLRLRSRWRQTVRIAALELQVELAEGEEVQAEVSAKFRLDPLRAELARAGLVVEEHWTDPAGDFALCLARRR